VADIFHEVDEEVRREQLKKLWDRYSIYLIALAVLIVAGMAAGADTNIGLQRRLLPRARNLRRRSH
jgi:hypothetical protein